MKPDLSARIALITGASSGMGRDYARELASRGVSLVLVARRTEPLEQLAQELRGRFSVAIHVMPTDLANEAARQSLHDELHAAGMTIYLLINNGGFGLFGPFAHSEWPRVQQLLEVYITSLTHLTHLFLPPLRAVLLSINRCRSRGFVQSQNLIQSGRIPL
jgi:short-subunit dehydrogenase